MALFRVLSYKVTYLFSNSKVRDVGIDAQIISRDDQSLKAMLLRSTTLTAGRDFRGRGER